MAKRKLRRIRRTMTPKEKARYAEMSKAIESEFPPGEVIRPPSKASDPPRLGEYFDLRYVVQQLRRAREAQGLSLTDIEHATGIDRSAISRLENAEIGNPTINTLSRYACAVGRRIEIALVESKPAAAKTT